MSNTLIDHFERLHLHHLSVQHKDEDYCRRTFEEHLRRWQQSKRRLRNQTYVQACADRRHQTCRYVMRIFGRKAASKIQFAHELRVLQALSDQKVDFIPRVHTAFLCRDYGLLVQAKWDGDILDFLFAQKEEDLEAAFQRAHHMAQMMMAQLHQAGYCYGQNTVDFRNVIVCRQPECPDVMQSDAGFHLGLQDWRGALPVTPVGAEQDLHQIHMLFMEISHLVRALRRHEPLPDHLPHAMRTKAAKLHQW